MNSFESSGGSCGKDTHPVEHMSLMQLAIQASPAHFVTSQPDGFAGVQLVSRATHINGRRRNWETRRQQSKACKRTEREAKRKLTVQPEISHEAAELIRRNQATRIDDIFWYHIRQSPARSLAWTRQCVFLHIVWCRQHWWSTEAAAEAAEVSVRRAWCISPESETQTRGADVKRACFDSPCIVNLISHQKKPGPKSSRARSPMELCWHLLSLIWQGFHSSASRIAWLVVEIKVWRSSVHVHGSRVLIHVLGLAVWKVCTEILSARSSGAMCMRFPIAYKLWHSKKAISTTK